MRKEPAAERQKVKEDCHACDADSEQRRLQEELSRVNEKMQDIINAIPGGVAIYKVSDIFETVYFSDGVPELSGYTKEEYNEMIKQDAAEMTYWEDTQMVLEEAKKAIETGEPRTIEFRKQHRDGHLVWVRVQIKCIGEEDGYPLLHCVFHNISDFKEAQSEKDHLLNSIPGGIASYQVEGEKFIPTFFSDGVPQLSGHSRQEYAELTKNDAMEIIYEQDRARVLTAAKASLLSGDFLDVSYRVYHKEGHLIWIHLNGRRMGPLASSTRYYAVFTGMSEETRLFQSIANETADGIYVIGKESYEILYINESKELSKGRGNCLGEKCYKVLYGKDSPCDFCTLKDHAPDGKEHEMVPNESGTYFKTWFRETNWNGIPAYTKYVRDVTEEVQTRREKERLNEYFQTLVKNLPGGIAVVNYKEKGSLVPEFISDGFMDMVRMTPEQVWDMYENDALMGVHPDDSERIQKELSDYLVGDRSHTAMVYRLRKGGGGYVWVKNTLSLGEGGKGEGRLYCVYHEMTKDLEEQEQLRQQYQEMIMKHYHTHGPDVLMVGHCNITRSQILDVIDYTDSGLLEAFGSDRNTFFTGISQFIPDEKQRQKFCNTFLDEPIKKAFIQGRQEEVMECFLKLPKDEKGCYVQIKVTMVNAPDSDDTIGILAISDITDKTVAEHTLRQLSVTGYDFVADLDLMRDSWKILVKNDDDGLPSNGCFSQWVGHMLRNRVMPADADIYEKQMTIDNIRSRLEKEGAYTFAFSVINGEGKIRTKSLTIFWSDRTLQRVCLARTDITDMMEEERRRKRELEKALAQAKEANQAKSSFLSSMSHDIRTPMNAIMGMTSVAVAHLGDQERVADCLDKISLSSKHLLSLINDVLDMSKIEQAKITLNRSKVSLLSLINQLSIMIRPQTRVAGQKLSFHMEDVEHEQFYADALRINQILLNLLSNAVKFTPEGGKIRFIAEELQAEKEGFVRYRFTVHDTGIGMSEDFLAHIFDPFVRNQETWDIEGTGLGLSITKGLVELMGGTITVESKVGEGSVFRVELECEIAESEKEEKSENRQKSQSGEEDRETSFAGQRFLIAEDNVVNAEIICELLRMFGVETEVRGDGKQTVDAFTEAEPGTYDAILMDVQMPHMNGYEATRAIRAKEREDAQTIPIIAMTANAFSEDIQAALEAGMNAHVAKPIDVDVLWKTLDRVLKQTPK